LAKLKKQREIQRRSRNRSEVLSVSIVGYTNAGKSTLFNRLTNANVYAADQLFATLDTTSRKIFLEGESPVQVILSDTVGFIRHLPHGLVAAFRSTLEETAQADVLLHVVDVNSPERHDQIAEVNKVLTEIGAQAIPQIVVYNKIDLQGLAAGVKRDEYAKIVAINLSAKTGAGLDDLKAALIEVRDAPAAAQTLQEWHPLNNH
jgi:GTP-binding protein HflX